MNFILRLLHSQEITNALIELNSENLQIYLKVIPQFFMGHNVDAICVSIFLSCLVLLQF